VLREQKWERFMKALVHYAATRLRARMEGRSDGDAKPQRSEAALNDV
jgi:hypothetical protein